MNETPVKYDDAMKRIDRNRLKWMHIFEYIPILGWIINLFLEDFVYNDYYENINAILAERRICIEPPAFKKLCVTIHRKMDWVNDRFRPEDSVAALLFDPEMKGIECVMDIEDAFNADVPQDILCDEQLTLGELLDRYLRKDATLSSPEQADPAGV